MRVKDSYAHLQSLPVRERGLKRGFEVWASRQNAVAPRAGAWIEACVSSRYCSSQKGRFPCGCPSLCLSARQVPRLPEWSLPVRERGLKLQILIDFLVAVASLPARERLMWIDIIMGTTHTYRSNWNHLF